MRYRGYIRLLLWNKQGDTQYLDKCQQYSMIQEFKIQGTILAIGKFLFRVHRISLNYI